MRLQYKLLIALTGVVLARPTAAFAQQVAVQDNAARLAAHAYMANLPLSANAASVQVPAPAAFFQTSSEGTTITGRVSFLTHGLTLAFEGFATAEEGQNFAQAVSFSDGFPSGVGGAIRFSASILPRLGDWVAIKSDLCRQENRDPNNCSTSDLTADHRREFASRVAGLTLPILISGGASIENRRMELREPGRSDPTTDQTVGWKANLGVGFFLTPLTVLGLSFETVFKLKEPDAVAICTPSATMTATAPFTCPVAPANFMERRREFNVRLELRRRIVGGLWLNPALVARLGSSSEDDSATTSDERVFGFRRLDVELGVFARIGGTTGLALGVTPVLHLGDETRLDAMLFLGGTFELSQLGRPG